MRVPHLTRRQFTRALGASVGAALLPSAPVAGGAGADPPPETPPPGSVRLDSNENPYGPAPAAVRALERSPRVAARYPDAAETELVEALARLHGVAPEAVILGCGSGEILRMADMAFLAPDRGVVVAEPTFEAVLAYAEVTRAAAVKVPLTADFRHDLPGLAAACDGRTGMVYVCNPNNPTGTIVRRDELQAFLARVPGHVVILVDEAYHHFVEDPGYASATEWIGSRPNLVVVRTFSKIYGLAGMRLGYAVGHPERIAALRRHRLWSSANAAVLEAGIVSLADREHVKRQRRLLNGARRRLCEALAREGRRFIPSEANFVMIDLGADVGPVIAALRARGVYVGRRFAALPRWLRVSIGTPGEIDAFLAALKAVAPAAAAAA